MNSINPTQPGTTETERVDDLFSQITRLSTLYRAWDRVEENHGCAGVDGVTVEKYAANLEENIGKLQKAILSNVPGVRITNLQDFEWMRKDPDLESIRGEPSFKSVSGS